MWTSLWNRFQLNLNKQSKHQKQYRNYPRPDNQQGKQLPKRWTTTTISASNQTHKGNMVVQFHSWVYPTSSLRTIMLMDRQRSFKRSWTPQPIEQAYWRKYSEARKNYMDLKIATCILTKKGRDRRSWLRWCHRSRINSRLNLP